MLDQPNPARPSSFERFATDLPLGHHALRAIGGHGPLRSVFLVHSLTDDELTQLRGQVSWLFRTIIVGGPWRHRFDQYRQSAFNPAPHL